MDLIEKIKKWINPSDQDLETEIKSLKLRAEKEQLKKKIRDCKKGEQKRYPGFMDWKESGETKTTKTVFDL